MTRNPATTIVGVLIGLWIFVLSPLYQFSETVLGGQSGHLWAAAIFLGTGVIIPGVFAAKVFGKEFISHLAIFIFAITAFPYLAFEHETKQWVAIRSGHFSKSHPIKIIDSQTQENLLNIPYTRPTLSYTMHIPSEWKINPIDQKGYFSTVDFQDKDGSSLEIRASCFSPSSISLTEAAYNKLNELNQTGSYKNTCFMQDKVDAACLIEPTDSEFESGRYVWMADVQGQDLAADIEVLAKHSNSQLRNQLLAVFSSIQPLEEKSETGFKCTTTTANWL